MKRISVIDFADEVLKINLEQGISTLDSSVKEDALRNIATAVSVAASPGLDVLDDRGYTFRVNNSFTINLDAIKPATEHIDLRLDEFIRCDDDNNAYIEKPLPYGCHVIFGSAGAGKSVFAEELKQRFGCRHFFTFERDFQNPSLIAVSPFEINEAVREAVTTDGSIIDSLRFVDLYGVGFPALEKGLNKGVFAFVQWLNAITMKLKVRIFVVVSTEREDPYVKTIFQNYLNSAANSCWFLQGFGQGLVIRADQPRSEWIRFHFDNDAIWSLSMTNNEKTRGSLEQQALEESFTFIRK